MSKSKEAWRHEVSLLPSLSGVGKIAEAIRRLDQYRHCTQIFVSPAPDLAQVRINALLDGKEIFMPGPALKDGFYRLRPFTVPFTKLAMAVSLKGLPILGELLPHNAISKLTISLLITEAMAVDPQGQCLGDGSGFFDLACAILNQCGALADRPTVVAVSAVHLTESLPVDPWDVRATALFTPQGSTFFDAAGSLPAIDWHHVPEQRIKKIAPLWKEWSRLQPCLTND